MACRQKEKEAEDPNCVKKGYETMEILVALVTSLCVTCMHGLLF